MPEKIERKDITFYLYDYSDNLALRAKRIYSPYNVKTLGRMPSEDYYDKPDFVEFKNGQYILSLKALGEVRYDQQKEWLGFYNPRGGQLDQGIGKNQRHINGRRFKNDGIHKVLVEKLNIGPKVETKTITERVEIQQIPEIVASNMNVDQLRGLAGEWNIELPGDILDLGDSDKIKNIIIDTMKEAGNIK